MKPIKFKQQNKVYAEDQPQYQPLPVLKIDDVEGNVISCWELSFKERLRVLFFGKIWMNLMSFNKPLTPSFLATNRKEVFSIPEDQISNWQKFRKYLKL